MTATTTNVRGDLRQRTARVQAAMAEQGLGGLVLYACGQHNMLRMDPVQYLTDVHVLGPHAVLVVPREGEPRLVVTPVWDTERVYDRTWLGDVEAVDEADLPAAVARRVSDLPDPIGIGGRRVMPVALARALAAAVGRPLQEADELLPRLAAVRTPIELERIRRAAEIADAGFQKLLDVAKVGMREWDLAAEVEAAMRALGAEDNFGLIGAGSHNVATRPPTDRYLEAGDVILAEITPCYQGYLAQLCRTVVLGEISPLQSEKYDILLRSYDAGLAAGRPGRPCGDVARAINGVIGEAGYAEYCKPPYMRTRGHSLGFGAVIPYDLTEDSPEPLAENMTLIIHPNQYIPETGYLMLGDTVVIGPDGPERLTRTPVQLFAAPGAVAPSEPGDASLEPSSTSPNGAEG